MDGRAGENYTKEQPNQPSNPCEKQGSEMDMQRENYKLYIKFTCYAYIYFSWLLISIIRLNKLHILGIAFSSSDSISLEKA